MKHEQKKGFSLTEVMIAIAILATGLLFVAGTFPVGIYFTAIAAEKTTAAVVADEAFAKVRLYGMNFTAFSNNVEQKSFEIDIWPSLTGSDEFLYPSVLATSLPAGQQKQYYWSALCRLVKPIGFAGTTDRLVQVTVFVNRRTGAGLGKYRNPLDRYNLLNGVNWPVPLTVAVTPVAGANNEMKLTIDMAGDETFINDDYKIIDNATGEIYRVVERIPDVLADTIVLDRWWNGATGSNLVWVIPPPVNGGRWPCVGIYQRVIRF